MARPSVTCYQAPGKAKSQKVCHLFAKGCGGKVVETDKFLGGPSAFYGVVPSNIGVLEACQKAGDDWYYIDNPYFGRGTFWRVTKNRRQCTGLGIGIPERFRQHGVKIKPWRKSGHHILVTTQSEWWYIQHGTTLKAWAEHTVQTLRHFSDRPIVVRLKPKAQLTDAPNIASEGELARVSDDAPLEKDFQDCWAVVTHTSNTAVEAICLGIPAFVDAKSCALPMALTDLGMIESPSYPDGRETWAGVLAANQWTSDEMASGKCWRDLNDLH